MIKYIHNGDSEPVATICIWTYGNNRQIRWPLFRNRCFGYSWPAAPAVTKSIAKQNLTSKRIRWNVISVNGAVLWRPSREKDYIHSQVKEQQQIRAVFSLTILTAMSCMPKFSMFCRTVDSSLGRNVCPIHFVSIIQCIHQHAIDWTFLWSSIHRC